MRKTKMKNSNKHYVIQLGKFRYTPDNIRSTSGMVDW